MKSMSPKQEEAYRKVMEYLDEHRQADCYEWLSYLYEVCDKDADMVKDVAPHICKIYNEYCKHDHYTDGYCIT